MDKSKNRRIGCITDHRINAYEKELRGGAVHALMRFCALMGFQMLVKRAFVTHRLLANVTYILHAIFWSPFMNLSVAFETMICSESSPASVTFEVFLSTMKFDVIF